MSGIGRAVWYLQWVALVGMPIWWVTASTFTGGGWGTAIAELLAMPTFALMLIAPILGVTIRRLRAARAMPKRYSIITLIQWVLGVVWPLTITMQDETFSTGVSALGALGIPEPLVLVLAYVSFLGFASLLIVGFITLVATTDTVPLVDMTATPLPPMAAVPAKES